MRLSPHQGLGYLGTQLPLNVMGVRHIFSLDEGLRLTQTQPLVSTEHFCTSQWCCEDKCTTDCGCVGQVTAQVLLFAHHQDWEEIRDAPRSVNLYYAGLFWLSCLGALGFRGCM